MYPNTISHPVKAAETGRSQPEKDPETSYSKETVKELKKLTRTIYKSIKVATENES